MQVNEYDYRNLPLSVTAGGVTTTYNYDDNGNRIAKVTNGSQYEYYLHDATGRQLAVIDLYSAHMKQINLFGNDQIGSVDVTWDGSNPTYHKQFYLKDHLGSIRVANGSDGTLLSARNYFSYGETQQEYINSSYNTKYKFTGKERDTETGLDYFGARYYNSELGRWKMVHY